MPALKVFLPDAPHNLLGLLLFIVMDDIHSVFIGHKLLLMSKDVVPEELSQEGIDNVVAPGALQTLDTETIINSVK